jgi:hypothetical protein
MHFLFLLLCSCGLNTARVPSLEVIAGSGEVVQAAQATRFAVIGATKTKTSIANHVQIANLVDDLRAQSAVSGLDGVILTGDYVTRSSTLQWKSFSRAWGDFLLTDGKDSANAARKPVAALVGNGERRGDPGLRGFGASFGTFPRDIGHNRVGSWSYFDVDSADITWRVLFLDANKAALGSRWMEQLFWVPTVVTDPAYDKLVVFINQPVVSLSTGHTIDTATDSRALYTLIDDNIPIGKLEAIVSSGVAVNEFFLPTGAYGEAFIVAGNSAVGSPGLDRWSKEQGIGEGDLAHEALFGLAQLNEYEKWAEALEWPERALDEARAQGSWDGFVAHLPGNRFPTSGWWTMEIERGVLGFSYRQRRYDGSFVDLFSARCDPNTGWATNRP